MLSIIIPIYNAGQNLNKCLDSILHQNWEDYEVWMVNDGSTDNSEEICEKYQSEDQRFHYLKQENAGPGAARNNGLDHAQGEFVVFLDADDWLRPNYLSTIAPYNEDAIVWGFTEVYSNKEVIQKPLNKHLDTIDGILYLKECGIYGMQWSCRFRRDIIEEHHLRIPTDIRLHEDNVFTNYYMQHVQSVRTLDYAGYMYMHTSEQSLCRRAFYPTDEMFKIAEYLWESSKQWADMPMLGNRIAYDYCSKLALSVLDMFDQRDVPQKTWEQKLERIRFVKHEINRLYDKLAWNRKKTHIIFHYLPAIAIALIYKTAKR